MHASRRLAVSGLLSGLLVLAGCAVTPPPKPADYPASIRTVGLLSALPDEAEVVRIGLTVFNNDRRKIPMAGEPSAVALADIEPRLRAARPDWVLKRLDPGLLTTTASSASLGAVAAKAGVDAVVAVVPTRHENGGGAGVGAYINALPGLKPLVGLHGVISIQVVDKAGTRLAQWSSFSEGYKQPDTGFTGDLKELDNPETLARVKQGMLGSLRWSVGDALSRLGF